MGDVATINPPGSVVRESHHTAVSLADIQRMAQAVAQSGMFGVKTADQAMSLMLIAQAEGLHPAIAARDYDIIQGRPAKKSEAMLRSFLTSGGRVKWHALDDKIADATFSHPAGGEVRITWDLARATVAGLAGKEMYKKFPRQMLRSRTISEGVRTVCPMATSGMYVPEEIEDMAPAAADEPPAPLPPPAKPSYAQADFEKNKAAWAALLATKPKGASAEIIAKLETKYTLTAEQRQAIAGMPALEAQ